MNNLKKSKLSDEDTKLIQVAKETADKLHLDGIHEVASALRTRKKQIFTGIHTNANVGFADVCGEVAAMCHALAHGEREYEAIVAVWGDGRGKYELLSPCGRCRELISDFSKDTFVIVGSLDEPYKVKISDLLPLKYRRLSKGS
ncbi:MAG: cytidine deaminase [Candidatus Bathyarchaeia archaeon]